MEGAGRRRPSRISAIQRPRWDRPELFLEHADEVFMNVARGIIGGMVVNGNHGMDAECVIKRSKFVRCTEAGLSRPRRHRGEENVSRLATGSMGLPASLPPSRSPPIMRRPTIRRPRPSGRTRRFPILPIPEQLGIIAVADDLEVGRCGNLDRLVHKISGGGEIDNRFFSGELDRVVDLPLDIRSRRRFHQPRSTGRLGLSGSGVGQ